MKFVDDDDDDDDDDDSTVWMSLLYGGSGLRKQIPGFSSKTFIIHPNAPHV